MIATEPTMLTKPPSVHYGTLSGSVWSRWVARIFRWGESLHPGAAFGTTDPVVIRTSPEIGPKLATSCVGIPLNYALREGDLLRCHYTPDDGPVRPAYRETFAGVVESCWADETGLLATLLVCRPEAHFDLEMLERAGALGHAGLCLVHEITTARVARTPWGAIVADVEHTNGTAVGFTAHPHLAGCRILRRLELGEALAEADAIPPAPFMVPVNWRADGGSPGVRDTALSVSSAIATGKIAINAVSQNLDSGGSGLVGLTGAFQTIRSLVITTQGGTIRVDGNCDLGCTTKTAAIGALEYHLRNLTTGVVSELAHWQLSDVINNFFLTMSTFLQETPGAGTYTIVLEARFASGSFTAPFANRGRLRATEFKR